MTIKMSISGEEMALATGLLAQIASDFANSGDENDEAKAERAKMTESFQQSASYLLSMLAGSIGGKDQALALIQEVMVAFGDGQSEENDSDEDDEY